MLKRNKENTLNSEFEHLIEIILEQDKLELDYLAQINLILDDPNKRLLFQVFLNEGICFGTFSNERNASEETVGRNIRSSILFALIAKKKYKSIILKLLDLEFNVDNGIYDSDCPDDLHQTPLIHAVFLNEFDIVRAILKWNPVLLSKTNAKLNILKFVSSVEVLNLIYEYALNHGIFDELLQLQGKNSEEIVPHLIDLHRYLNIHELKKAFRLISFKFPEQFRKLNTYFQELKASQRQPLLDVGAFFNNEFENLNLSTSSFFSFNAPIPSSNRNNFSELKANASVFTLESADTSTVSLPETLMRVKISQQIEMKLIEESKIFEESKRTREQAVYLFVEQFKNLMSQPILCVPYLKFINHEFLRYFESKHQPSLFPVLDQSQYEMVNILGYEYPLPLNDYQGIKKYSSLQEYLMALFVDSGLPHIAYKEIGELPTDLSQEMKGSGRFVLEPRFPNHLNLMKLAHPIQMAILIYAHQENCFNLCYQEDNQSRILNLSDLLKALISLESTQFFEPNTMPNHSSKSAWDLLFDFEQTNFFTFSDPSRLASMIILNADQWDIRALADYLIDQYCKKINRFIKVSNQLIHPETISKEIIIENIKEGLLSTPLINPQIIKAWHRKELGRHNNDESKISDYGTEYNPCLISQRFYDRSSLFQAQKFVDASISSGTMDSSFEVKKMS